MKNHWIKKTDVYTKIREFEARLVGQDDELYKQAYSIISDLTNELESQRQECNKALEEGFEKACQMLEEERKKSSNLEVALYDEYDQKLKDIKDFMIDKVAAYLDKLIGENGPEKIRAEKSPKQIIEEAINESVPDLPLKQRIKELEARNIRLQMELDKINKLKR